MIFAPVLLGYFLAACAPGAICFSGDVEHGKTFKKQISADLNFVLEPGWTITVVPIHPEGDCIEYASVVSPPYRSHRDIDIDTDIDKASGAPREFNFVTNCGDYKTEAARLEIVLWPYTFTKQQQDEALAKLGTSPVGKGRLWITKLKTSHGQVQTMSFRAEIKLPR